MSKKYVRSTYYGVHKIFYPHFINFISSKHNHVDLANDNELYEKYKVLWSMLIDTMKAFNVNEFITTFPIAKHYDGDKYGTIDYYSTIAHIDKLFKKKNEIIGDKLFDLISEYDNALLRMFQIKSLDFTDAISYLDGKPTVFEELFKGSILEDKNTKKDLPWMKY